MENDTKKDIRKKIFETRVKSAFYSMEHKEDSKELLEELQA